MTDMPRRRRTIWVGYDSREVDAYRVFELSIQQTTPGIPVEPIVLEEMVRRGLYDRPTDERWVMDERGRSRRKLYDIQSAEPEPDGYDGAMSTEFAISRFLTMKLAKTGLALFADCDMLARSDLNRAFDLAEQDIAEGRDFALWCCKHPNYDPAQTLKMDGQTQTAYRRKNWSSFVIYDCDHVVNRNLTLSVINSMPGRWLHGFQWLPDDLIGSLPLSYNHLVGIYDGVDPATVDVVHWTNGGPWFEGYRDVPFASEWLKLHHSLPHQVPKIPF